MRRLFCCLLVAAAAQAGPSLETRVASGVERGAAFLLSRYDKKKGWGGAHGMGTYGNQGRAYPYEAGPTALVCFALLKADLPRKHKTIRRSYGWLRRTHRTPAVTYEQAVLLLFVAEYGGAARCPDYSRGPRRAERSAHRFRKPKDHPFATEQWTWMVDLTKKLLSFQNKVGGWRYYPNDFHSGGPADVSSTQFALLALRTASRCGVAVPAEAFRRARGYLLRAQQKEGPAVPRAIHIAGDPADVRDRARGFPYIADAANPGYRRVTGGMTAAGVASLLLVRDELGTDEELDRALLDGFAWLGRYFTVHVNPGHSPFLNGSYHHTWLYALERSGDLARRELIGGRSWFAEGARYLLAKQRDDGAIVDPTCMNPQDTLGTAFALLFLTRASRPISGS